MIQMNREDSEELGAGANWRELEFSFFFYYLLDSFPLLKSVMGDFSYEQFLGIFFSLAEIKSFWIDTL